MRLRKKSSTNVPPSGFQKELQRLQLVLLVSLTVILLLGIGASVYVYRLIYTSLSQVQEIVAQKSALSAAIIDFNRYEEVEKKWNDKYMTNAVVAGRNPFIDAPITVPFVETATTTISTSTDTVVQVEERG